MGSLRTPLWVDGEGVLQGGTDYTGFKVSFGGLQGEVNRSYDDINKILGKTDKTLRTSEVDTPDGHFKSYSVSTS